MMKKIFTNVRIIILIICLLLAVASINPTPTADGVAIRSVDKNSSAADAGMLSPQPTDSPRSREVVLAVNNIPMNGVAEYYSYISSLPVNKTVSIRTNRQTYLLKTKESYELVPTGKNITKKITEEIFDEKLNKTINSTRLVKEPEVVKNVLGTADLGLVVYEAPTSNIRKGLDLTGGTRVILKPDSKVNEEDMETIILSITERLNVFGLSDIIVRDSNDLEGNQFIVVEIAGATEDEVADLIARQGKFEATIANKTVFIGGKNDIPYVCRSADCSGLDPRQSCGIASDGLWYCGFFFQISLSAEAAQRQADVTATLDIVTENGGSYLSEPLILYLDDQEVDSLNIASTLKGSPLTDISITGSGSGTTQELAQTESLTQMKRLQTILKTGSLPVKLNIEKTDTISPVLGKQFLRNAILVGLSAILAVVLTVFFRYRRFIISIPMVVIMMSEATIILGVAAAIGWNLDLAAIAGIIIAIGTGVDDQIVIADETIIRKKKNEGSWKDRLKQAFFIIFAAYFTLVVAMIPLWFAGAGMLRGFAITTILGVSIGVFITRPAYASLLKILSEE